MMNGWTYARKWSKLRQRISRTVPNTPGILQLSSLFAYFGASNAVKSLRENRLLKRTRAQRELTIHKQRVRLWGRILANPATRAVASQLPRNLFPVAEEFSGEVVGSFVGQP